MKKILSTGTGFALVVLLAGCEVPPPENEMQRRARMAAAAEITARQCAGYAGGYSAARDLRRDANRHVTLARQLGATDADMADGSKVAQMAFDNAVIWLGQQEACNQMVSQLAWNAE